MGTFRDMLKHITPLRRAVLRLRHGKPFVKSYSQLGEDVIVRYVFQKLRIKHPTYIDIGANDPQRFNNTALLYEEGSRGVNVEPHPMVFKELAMSRVRDVNLNIGISDTEGEADFYAFNDDKLSTFSKKEAERLIQNNLSLSFTILKIPLHTVHAVIEKHCSGMFPDFLSLDAEGLDDLILKSIDYSHSAPKVICVETIRSPDEIEHFLVSKGYVKLSGSFLNTVFCQKDLWENR